MSQGVDHDPSPSTVASARIDRAAADEEIRSWYQRLGECFTELGFPATQEGNGLSIYTPPGSESQYKAADTECTARVGPHPELVPYSQEEFGYLYDSLLESAKCLRDHGYQVKTEMPTRETWVGMSVAAEHSGKNSPPSPYEGFDSNAVEKVCPYPDGTDIERHRAEARKP